MDIVILTSGPKERIGSPSKFKTLLPKQRVCYRTIGAYKIAHACRKQGYSVQVIDHVTHFTEQELVELLFKFIDNKTKILAISTTFIVDSGVMPTSLMNSISAVSQEFPEVKIVLGGYSTYIAKVITEFQVYATVTEYGEDIFTDIANFVIRQEKEPSFTIEFNDKTGKMFKVYSKPLTDRYNIEIDDFRFHKSDGILPNETLPLEISRGCIFKCKFCSHLLLGRGKLDYLRSFELIKQELLYNYENWGTTSYYIICDTFNDTVIKMTEWHKMVMSLPFKISYTAYLRADLLDKFQDVPYMLQESGLVTCFHGIESLNRESALSIGKGWSGSHAREYIPRLYHDIWKGQVLQSLSFIVGLPGDTRENNIDTADWFIQNKLYHIMFKTLGLTNNKNLKNLSEFERNSEKYGYTFESQAKSTTEYGLWKNDYWSVSEVYNFVQTELDPKVRKYNATIGSWDAMYYIGLGYRKDSLRSNQGLYEKLFDYPLMKYKKLLMDQTNG